MLMPFSHAHAAFSCEREGIARRAPGAADSRRRFGEDGVDIGHGAQRFKGIELADNDVPFHHRFVPTAIVMGAHCHCDG
jgi:hypothetical protein